MNLCTVEKNSDVRNEESVRPSIKFEDANFEALLDDDSAEAQKQLSDRYQPSFASHWNDSGGTRTTGNRMKGIAFLLSKHAHDFSFYLCILNKLPLQRLKIIILVECSFEFEELTLVEVCLYKNKF